MLLIGESEGEGVDGLLTACCVFVCVLDPGCLFKQTYKHTRTVGAPRAAKQKALAADGRERVARPRAWGGAHHGGLLPAQRLFQVVLWEGVFGQRRERCCACAHAIFHNNKRALNARNTTIYSLQHALDH